MKATYTQIMSELNHAQESLTQAETQANALTAFWEASEIKFSLDDHRKRAYTDLLDPFLDERIVMLKTVLSGMQTTITQINIGIASLERLEKILPPTLSVLIVGERTKNQERVRLIQTIVDVAQITIDATIGLRNDPQRHEVVASFEV